MQLMLNIADEKPAALRLCAQFLIDQANLMEQSEKVPPQPQVANSPGPLAPPAPVQAAAPTAPVAPTATAPVSSTVSPTLALVSVSPPVVPSAPIAPAAPAVDEYDSSGVPFDSRIHQVKRGQKKDGTWKLQKGIADTLVSAVMQELAPRVKRPAPTAPTAHYINGVLQPPASAQPAPIAPAAPIFGQAPLPAGVDPAPVSPQPAATPGPVGTQISPPAPNATPAPDAAALDPFRALIRKIATAKDKGWITMEQVTQAVADAGAPSLNLLSNMQHLIPAVEGNIDLLIAMAA